MQGLGIQATEHISHHSVISTLFSNFLNTPRLSQLCIYALIDPLLNVHLSNPTSNKSTTQLVSHLWRVQFPSWKYHYQQSRFPFTSFLALNTSYLCLKYWNIFLISSYFIENYKKKATSNYFLCFFPALTSIIHHHHTINNQIITVPRLSEIMFFQQILIK